MGDTIGAKADFEQAGKLDPKAQKLIEANDMTNAGVKVHTIDTKRDP